MESTRFAARSIKQSTCAAPSVLVKTSLSSGIQRQRKAASCLRRVSSLDLLLYSTYRHIGIYNIQVDLDNILLLIYLIVSYSYTLIYHVILFQIYVFMQPYTVCLADKILILLSCLACITVILSIWNCLSFMFHLYISKVFTFSYCSLKWTLCNISCDYY